MSRINSNVNSQISQRILNKNNMNVSKSLERLSTGFKINRGADGPAALISSEKLRSEKTQISAAIGNAERADQIANIAEGGLQEISTLLIEVQGLVGESANEAGLSTEEKEANQVQIDQILQTIDRIASTTSFNGSKLLNGNYEFQVSGGSNFGNLEEYNIDGAKIPRGKTVNVDATVTTSAQHAGLFLSLGAGANINLGGATATDGATSSLVIEIAGSKGAREFTFASGTSKAAIADSINSFTSVTGVSAVASGTYLELKSSDYGSSEFVSVDIKDTGGIIGGGIYAMSSNNTAAAKTGSIIRTFAAAETAAAERDEGLDIAGIINGVAAAGKGRTLSINSDALAVTMTLTAGQAQKTGAVDAFTITGGGANFNLGPGINVGNKVGIGIGNVVSRNLGSEGNGFLDDLGSGKTNNVVDGNLEDAQKIVDDAINDITGLRGRIGAFQRNVIGSTINSLGIALENTTAAESAIRDTDFAQETADLTRNQILVQAATNSLAISNAQPNNVLSLIR